MVNKENMLLWIEALESGQHRQGSGHLAQKDDDVMRYCCMGVACEVALANGVRMAVRDQCGKKGYDGNLGIMPWAVVQWLGLQSQNPLLKPPEISGSELRCIRANDDLALNFQQIAVLLRSLYLPEGEDERPTAD